MIAAMVLVVVAVLVATVVGVAVCALAQDGGPGDPWERHWWCVACWIERHQ